MAVQFAASAETVDVFDYLEVSVYAPAFAGNPFTQTEIRGEFRAPDGQTVRVEGFCDAEDGEVYRVRFMPQQAGEVTFRVEFRRADAEATFSGGCTARDAGVRGLLRVDPAYPAHFMWQGTGEHFFWNATTAYLLAGCSDDAIEEAIERLADFGVNRIRVSLCPSRQADAGRWYEPQVKPSEDFTFCYGPWPAARPNSVTDPGYDVSRFEVAYWNKFERLLTLARNHDMIVQVIFFTDAQEPQNYPFDRARLGDDPDERRYYAYAVARLAAFSNVEWCLTNEWRLFRPDEWAERIGAYLDASDPYAHLTSVHGHEVFPFRASPWADFALYQRWDEHGGHAFMLKNRQEQAATGRVIPQINEEYGYEDHYPQGWGESRIAPSRNGGNRCRLAWEIVMAGAYQTTGESAANGLGGWVNGRGDASMQMLTGYARLADFFRRAEWWKTVPADELVTGDAYCLAEPGKQYLLYLPSRRDQSSAPSERAAESSRSIHNQQSSPGEGVTLRLEPGRYRAERYSPRTGEIFTLPDVEGDNWTIPELPDRGDWAFRLQRAEVTGE